MLPRNRNVILVPKTIGYINRGSFVTAATGAVFTTPVNIGLASPDRLVVMATVEQNSHAVSSVIVNGVSLAAAVNPAGWEVWYALVPSGSGAQTVTVTWSTGSFLTRGFTLWTLRGLNSNTPKQTASAVSVNNGTTINVSAGDFMFASVLCGTPNWNGSTQVAAETNTINSGINAFSADWIVAQSNASFAVNPKNGVTATSSYATFR